MHVWILAKIVYSAKKTNKKPKFGWPFRLGLEAGSKAELWFEDAEYISLALIARKIAFKTVVLFEQEEELNLVIELSKKLNTRPVVGVQAKLRTRHAGHCGSTSGEKGKSGLYYNADITHREKA
ncbi:hypothetical protein CDL15_Pgr021624 [Punica granatum]|uniref:Arginine decarboxylase n=1 Tax=Punica granatum TaxID=22663 RepID=A0A218WSX2_PUNGR|nr:hypothetical protein CDL15_Pgr021624 [Punica granatum]